MFKRRKLPFPSGLQLLMVFIWNDCVILQHQIPFLQPRDTSLGVFREQMYLQHHDKKHYIANNNCQRKRRITYVFVAVGCKTVIFAISHSQNLLPTWPRIKILRFQEMSTLNSNEIIVNFRVQRGGEEGFKGKSSFLSKVSQWTGEQEFLQWRGGGEEVRLEQMWCWEEGGITLLTQIQLSGYNFIQMLETKNSFYGLTWFNVSYHA